MRRGFDSYALSRAARCIIGIRAGIHVELDIPMACAASDMHVADGVAAAKARDRAEADRLHELVRQLAWAIRELSAERRAAGLWPHVKSSNPEHRRAA